MIDGVCKNCVFSTLTQLPPPNIGKVLICRRFPPTPQLVMDSSGRITGLQSNFPPTLADSGCGEFQSTGVMLAS